MTKEPHHPKAINIICPSPSFSLKRLPPTITTTRSGGPTPARTESRKIKVASSARIAIGDQQSLHHQRSPTRTKPQLNLYHPPPPPRPSQSQQIFPKGGRINTIASPSRLATYDLYKPSRQHQPQQPQQPSQRPGSTLSASLSHSHTTSVRPSASISGNGRRPSQPLHQRCPPLPTPLGLSKSITHTNIHVPRSISPSSLSTESEHSDVASEEDDDDDDNDDAVQGKEDDDDDGDDQVINEARVNRKIADLEISNRSLLAVNEMLEITVRRQASQVAQLKKQLGQEGPFEIKPLALSLDKQNNDADVDDEDDESDDNWEKDALFHRMRQLTERMIQHGEASLRFKYKGRVLSQYLPDGENEETQINAKEPETPSPPTTEKDRRRSLTSNRTHSSGHQSYFSNTVVRQPRQV